MITKQENEVLSNKDYKYFVVDIIEGLDILSGWEYKEDALDSMNELKEELEYNTINEELKVYTRRYLNTINKKGIKCIS